MISMTDPSTRYASSGVDVDREERGMRRLVDWVGRSFALRPGKGRPVLPLGHYANVIALNDTLGPLRFKNLDDVAEVQSINTTTENLCRYVHDQISAAMKGEFDGTL